MQELSFVAEVPSQEHLMRCMQEVESECYELLSQLRGKFCFPWTFFVLEELLDILEYL